MNAEQFAYWLQGYAELNDAPPTAEQWLSIREHLALVFQKVTPPVQQDFPGTSPLWAPRPVAAVSQQGARSIC